MSWEQLQATAQEARELREQERRLGPVACPVCGLPLDYRERDGLLNCRDGHYQTTGGLRE